VVHYTCNSLDKDVLEKLGILTIGGIFPSKDGSKVAENEVLLIPKKLFKKAGRGINTIEVEALLRDIGKSRK
jgi:hypothetical protein